MFSNTYVTGVSKRVRFFGFTCLLCCIAPQIRAQQVPQGRFAPGRLLVRFRDTVRPDQARNVLQSLRLASSDELSAIGVHIVQLPPNASETAYQNILQQRPDVEFAELDRIRSHEQVQQIIPNDPQFGSQWHLSKISAPSAWPVTTGSTSVIIAIADTGVDPAHPDLITKLVPGWNVNDNNSDTRDVYWHGTMVAGTAAAATNNAIGVASVAWNSWIMPIRVSMANGSAYDSVIAKGITWAADRGARVVNVSYDVTDSSTVSAAAKYMYGKGGVVTVSAGNYSTFDSIPNDPYMITVGATDPNDLLYSWSDRGTDIDVVAPGCVTSTYMGGGYSGGCGTSFSAPVVAGVAALVMSAKPGLTASQVTSILQNSADDLGASGWDTTFGSGRVNAARAVNMAAGSTSDTQPPTVFFSSPAAGATLSGTAVIQVSATDNVGVTSVVVTANGTTIGSSGSFSWNTTGWANGSYTLVATARDAAGNSASVSRTVIVGNMTDSTPPAVALTSPALGSTITGTVNLAVNATDNVGVMKVQYYSDGALIGTVSSAPFAYKWNTRKVAPGAHSLQAKAYDAAGNVGSSAVVQVTVRR